jgi:hypothetical protein
LRCWSSIGRTSTSERAFFSLNEEGAPLARQSLQTETAKPVGSGSESRSLDRIYGVVALTALVMSAVSLGIAPLLMPESYSWVEHTTSESAAQGVDGAWLARLGFLLFGSLVLLLALAAERKWGLWARILHAAFGVFMIATAAFSHRPWEPGVPYDRTEDLLHSITATGMGFAFAFGVVAVLLRRRANERFARSFDIVAVAASVLFPLGMTVTDDFTGLIQRMMFLIAYVWYGSEAIRMIRRSGRSQ